jgi:hypothetical protein
MSGVLPIPASRKFLEISAARKSLVTFVSMTAVCIIFLHRRPAPRREPQHSTSKKKIGREIFFTTD